MELYEQITHIMELYGLTFDEAFTYFILVMVGSVAGFGFFLSTCFDLGRYLYRAVKNSLCFIIRRIRDKGKAEP